MFLSNPAKKYLLLIVVSFVLYGCGWRQNNENTAIPVIAEPKSNIPFSSKEPDVFQADIIRSTDTEADVSFYARKGTKWRYDFFVTEERRFSKLHADRNYSINHQARVYAEEPADGVVSTPSVFLRDLTQSLLHKREYAKFEEISREGNIRKYRVQIGDPPMGEAIIYFDESLGMIVKQEFNETGAQANSAVEPRFKFELSNVSLEVHDSVFEIPKGFRKVTWNEFRRSQENDRKK
ncbi:MAG: hypothetical protein ACT4O9_07595 [Blastocatellia bacterium]